MEWKVEDKYGTEKKMPHLEFKMKHRDYHRSRYKTGDWTDDSDQMILILLSLLDNKGKVRSYMYMLLYKKVKTDQNL